MNPMLIFNKGHWGEDKILDTDNKTITFSIKRKCIICVIYAVLMQTSQWKN